MNVKTLALYAVSTLSLTGCAAETPEPNTPVSPAKAPPSPGDEQAAQPTAPAAAAGAQASLRIDENLARLQALGIFGVGTLLVAHPEGLQNCYGPCPGDEPKIQAAKEKAAVRLAAFTDRAEVAAKAPAAGPCETNIEANIAALKALSIVDVQGFTKTKPKTQVHCYNQPCADDLAAAKAADDVKACQLEAIVRATKG